MTARAEKFTFQTRPTPAQNDAMVKANRARQYRDVQEATADFQAARLRYELARLHSQPNEDVLRAAGESCCAVEDEADEFSLPLFLAICIGALGLWCAIGYATWWLVGLFMGVNA